MKPLEHLAAAREFYERETMAALKEALNDCGTLDDQYAAVCKAKKSMECEMAISEAIQALDVALNAS